jgi:hypothetical protein
LSASHPGRFTPGERALGVQDAESYAEYENSLLGIEPRLFGRPVLRLFAMPTELSQTNPKGNVDYTYQSICLDPRYGDADVTSLQ